MSMRLEKWSIKLFITDNKNQHHEMTCFYLARGPLSSSFQSKCSAMYSIFSEFIWLGLHKLCWLQNRLTAQHQV